MKKLTLVISILIFLVSFINCAVNAEENETVDVLYRELKDNNPRAIMHFAYFSKGVLYWELAKNKNNSKCMGLLPKDSIDFFMAMYQRQEFKIGEDSGVAIIKTLIAQCPDLLKN